MSYFMGFQFCIIQYVFVKVNPMKAANVGDTLKSMTSGKDSAMGNLLSSGDVSKATQMACAVLSLVDQSDGKLGASDKKSVRIPYSS